LNDAKEHSSDFITCGFGFGKLLRISEPQLPGNGQLRLQFKTRSSGNAKILFVFLGCLLYTSQPDAGQ